MASRPLLILCVSTEAEELAVRVLSIAQGFGENGWWETLGSLCSALGVFLAGGCTVSSSNVVPLADV